MLTRLQNIRLLSDSKPFLRHLLLRPQTLCKHLIWGTFLDSHLCCNQYWENPAFLLAANMWNGFILSNESVIAFLFSNVFFFFTGYYQLNYAKLFHRTGYIDNIAKQVGIHKNKYAVIIDAGSTGTRILAFSFQESIIGMSFFFILWIFI